MPSRSLTRRGILTSSALLPPLAAAQGSQAAPGTKRPNIVIFFTDQQRWDTLGCYGGPMGLTPNLDRFAASGVRFEHACTNQPVCAPARGVLQTGKYATTTGVINNGLVLKDNEQTLAHHFGANGYQTAYVGKWHLGGSNAGPVPPPRRGGYEWWAASDILEFTSTPFEGHVFDGNGQPVHFSDYRVDGVAGIGMRFLAERDRSRPFFLTLSFVEPHHQNSLDAFVAPKGYADRYRNSFHIPPDLAPFPGDWRSQLADYYGIVSRIDEVFGRFMAELKAQGIDRDTIVIFTSDHGCHFRTRNSEYKRSCHDSSIRIPMIFSGPGFSTPRVVPEQVSLVDVAPTLLEAAGIAPSAAMQGRSFLPLANGRNAGWRDEVLVHISESELGRAIRTPQWKYSVYDPNSKHAGVPHSVHYAERYLYDLRADPAELVNLIGRPQYANVVRGLRARLLERVAEIGEPAARIEPARYYA